MKNEIKIDFALNLFLTYLFLSPVLLCFGWMLYLCFSLGMIGAEIFWFMINDDAEKMFSSGQKVFKIGFLKRYFTVIVIFFISSSFSMKGLILSFLGFELLSLTIFTFWNKPENRKGQRAIDES